MNAHAKTFAASTVLAACSGVAAFGGTTCCCPSPCDPCLIVSECPPAVAVCAPRGGVVAAPNPREPESLEPLPEGGPDVPATPPAIASGASPAAPPATAPASPTASPPSTSTPPPATEPAATPGEPAPATPPVEDLFDEGSAPPGGATPPADGAAPAGATPPSATPASPPAGEDIFDVGDAGGVLNQPGGWSSDLSRQWTDASGRHSCAARLTAVSPLGVVLAPAAGGEVRVPFRALSVADLQFVRQQIQARRAQLAAAGASIAASPSL